MVRDVAARPHGGPFADFHVVYAADVAHGLHNHVLVKDELRPEVLSRGREIVDTLQAGVEVQFYPVAEVHVGQAGEVEVCAPQFQFAAPVALVPDVGRIEVAPHNGTFEAERGPAAVGKRPGDQVQQAEKELFHRLWIKRLNF